MKTLKLFLFLLLSTLFSKTGFSQYYYFNNNYYDNPLVWEFGAHIGAMNCITDIGGANSDNGYYINEIRTKNFKLSGGIYAGIMYNNFIGARLQATWGSVQSNDNQVTSTASDNLKSKTNRNLHFRSPIAELVLLAEFHPLNLKWYDEGPPLLSPYLLAGVGWYSFNPQAQYNNRWVDLQPLRTEGQGFTEFPDRKPYKMKQVNIPLGIGLRYELSDLFNIRFEFLHRILFNDYLDDASNRRNINPLLFRKYLTPINAAYAMALYNPSINGKNPARRGNPEDKDAYMSFSLKFGIVLGRDQR